MPAVLAPRERWTALEGPPVYMVNIKETRKMENVMRVDGQSTLALCGCGKLHYTYGPLTLHFERDEFLRFASSVGRLGVLVRQAAKGLTLLPGHIPDSTLCQ